MDPAELVIFGNLAVLFIRHTIDKNKHNLGGAIDEYLNDGGYDEFKRKYVRNMPSGATAAACALAGNQATVFPCDLFLLRPNIEHYMLGIIFGRGGGPEELGATFWGQTELSVYDDTQHCIWGMSYKYHERAIVTNERNLIRVFDVAFDGYSGGNDSRIVKWESEDLSQFSSATKDTTKAYSGPSMLVFALPVHANAFDSFPNPVVFHPTVTGPDGANAIPDRSLRFVDLQRHCPFAEQNEQCSWTTYAIHQVYKTYYEFLDIDEWRSMQAMAPTAGALACADETSVQIFSFHGHMAVTSKSGVREETQGTGHLGPSFVGVASVREGRGLIQTSRQALTQRVS